MKGIISIVFLATLILFNMESQAQSFKTTETKDLKLQVSAGALKYYIVVH